MLLSPQLNDEVDSGSFITTLLLELTGQNQAMKISIDLIDTDAEIRETEFNNFFTETEFKISPRTESSP